MKEAKQVVIKCRSALSLPLEELHEFQGNLKDLFEEDYRALRQEVLDHGFNSPFAVWFDPRATVPENQKAYIIDGHQRKRVLLELRKEGVTTPKEYPCSEVFAESFEEAKRILLAHASKYGRVNRQGLYEFLEENKIPYEDYQASYRLPEIEPFSFHAEYYADLPGPTGPEPQQLPPGVADGAFDKDGNPANGATVVGEEGPRKLSDRFLVPPFSVLDARQGYWKERKTQWLSFGIKSEVGRGRNLLGMSETVLEPDPEKRAMKKAMGGVNGVPSNPEMIPGFYDKIRGGMKKEQIVAEHLASGSAATSGTSIFDPVLCELVYRWFCPKGGTILDPFAGGSVRGIVASKLGLQYVGSELREEQVKANQDQGRELCSDPHPVWHCGDSRKIDESCVGVEADLVFSCPPYADLEVYSDDPRDISNMPYEQFLEIYREIIRKSCGLLKKNRFAAFVVGEVRQKKGGAYRGFVQDTIRAFLDAGLSYYNEGILVTSVGTLAIRTGRIFSASRKLGKTHQNLLVFCKGDPLKAVEACGEVEITDLEPPSEGDLPPPPSPSSSGGVQSEATQYGEKVTSIEGAT